METLEFREASVDLMRLAIQGDRVTLRPITSQYAPELFKEFTPEITRYMYPKPPERIEETLQFISDSVDAMRARLDVILVITKKETGEPLGCCGLHSRGKPRSPELGIWVKKSAHGNKYGREAVTTLARWAARLLDFDLLLYPVDKANLPSRKIAESLGGTIFKELKVPTMSGGMLDEVVYRIERDAVTLR